MIAPESKEPPFSVSTGVFKFTDAFVDNVEGLFRSFYKKDLVVGEVDQRLIAAVYGIENELAEPPDRRAAFKERLKQRIEDRQISFLQAELSDEKHEAGIYGFAVVEPYKPRLKSLREKVVSWLRGPSFVLTALFIESGIVDEETNDELTKNMIDSILVQHDRGLGVKLHFLKRGQSQNIVERLIKKEPSPLSVQSSSKTSYERATEIYDGVDQWRRTAEFPVAHENLTTQISNAIRLKLR